MPKPKDFTESAVKLCNPVEVKKLLEKLSAEGTILESVTKEMSALVPKELIDKAGEQSKKIADLQEQIRAAIKEFGSYQDTENERYGVQYERKHKVYNLDPFKKQFPKFVELCIKEVIDITALEGQIKGKLLRVDELEKADVLSYTTDYAFYVR